MKRQYFYDKQIRRYLTQIIRLFSGFQVQYLKEVDGKTIEAYRTIPCVWSDMSRLGATWLSQNSENVLATAPLMALTITNITPSPEYRYAPLIQQDTHFMTKKKNPTGTGGYVNEPDKMYKVSQHMPVPYVMEFNIDILVTSTHQKLEILEQLLCMFNPGFRMKANSSPFDIGKYFEIKLENVQWTSKSVPQGTSDEMDFATLGFSVVPVFINVPSKVRKNTIIKKIETNIGLTDEESSLEQTLDDLINRANPIYESIIVTPTEHSLEVTKLKETGQYIAKALLPEQEQYSDWNDIFEYYGKPDEETSWLRIRRNEDAFDENFDIYAKFRVLSDPTELELLFEYDTFKVANQDPVDRIINPNKYKPEIIGNGFGVRYLLSRDIENDDWGIKAPAQSIIESTEEGWVVVFDPSTEQGTEHYVINIKTGDQYYFDGYSWSHYLVGTYQPQYWMFDIQELPSTTK